MIEMVVNKCPSDYRKVRAMVAMAMAMAMVAMVAMVVVVMRWWWTNVRLSIERFVRW